MVGKWKSEMGHKLYARCECEVENGDEIQCHVETFKRSDSSTYSIVKFHIQKERWKWVVHEEVFGIRQQYQVFHLDSSRSRTFEVQGLKSQQLFAKRQSENSGEQTLVVEQIQNGKLVITDYHYTFNFERVD